MSLPTTHNLLKRFPNDLYVETGIYRGDGLAMAFETVAFENYFGLDVDPDCLDFCKHRFDLNRYPMQHVALYQQDTAKDFGSWLLAYICE